MSTELQEVIKERVSGLNDEELHQVLNFVNGLRTSQPLLSLGELLDESFKEVPSNLMNELPADASLNLDHYLYGAAKK